MRNLEWLQEALDSLTEAWLQSSSRLRQAITQACRIIEKRILIDPEHEGESRDEGRRITFEPPLAVLFRIEADGQTVTVLKVHLILPRKK